MKDYLELDRPVPFREGDHYYESKLKKADGSTSRGRFGRSVRAVTDKEYSLTLAAGFPLILDPEVHQAVPDGAGGD